MRKRKKFIKCYGVYDIHTTLCIGIFDTIPEVSKILGIPVSTCYSALKRNSNLNDEFEIVKMIIEND